jgi:hypothetical protein
MEMNNPNFFLKIKINGLDDSDEQIVDFFTSRLIKKYSFNAVDNSKCMIEWKIIKIKQTKEKLSIKCSASSDFYNDLGVKCMTDKIIEKLKKDLFNTIYAFIKIEYDIYKPLCINIADQDTIMYSYDV